MQIYVTKNVNSKTGFGLKIINNDEITMHNIDSSFYEKKTGKTWLRLPENPTGRKLLDAALCQTDDYELTDKAARHTTGTSTPKRSWLSYMTEEEAKIVEAIKVKCEARAQRENLEAQIAMLQAQLAATND